MEEIKIIKIYDRKIWIEDDFLGSKHIMMQSDAPDSNPFCYCSFNYGYGYTDNQSLHDASLRMAISLGAQEPVEYRLRKMPDFNGVQVKDAPICDVPQSSRDAVACDNNSKKKIVRYRVYFERFNFDFVPPLKQSADVVFDTDIPDDLDHIEEFEEAGWEAMWKQNPHWNDASSPVEGGAGWSSVLGGNKYEVV